MSTYYQLTCDACEESGGWYSRQAWGWGNFDIFGTFKFLVAHAYCEPPPYVISEHDDKYGMEREEKWEQRLRTDEELREEVWPHADEWDAVTKGWETAKRAWILEALKDHH